MGLCKKKMGGASKNIGPPKKYGRRGKIWADDEYDLFNGDYRENPKRFTFYTPKQLMVTKPPR